MTLRRLAYVEVPDATTPFGENLPEGTLVLNEATGILSRLSQSELPAATLTTATAPLQVGGSEPDLSGYALTSAIPDVLLFDEATLHDPGSVNTSTADIFDTIGTSGASASSGASPWYAIDNIGNVNTWTGNPLAWWKYDFGAGTEVVIDKYRILAGALAFNWATGWIFEGSNDDASWDLLETQTGVTWPGNGTYAGYFTFPNVTRYRYYRITSTDVGNNFGIVDMEWIEREGISIKDDGITFAKLNSSLVLDEDNMVSNSDTALATQQSIKKYVDDSVEATDLSEYLTSAEVDDVTLEHNFGVVASSSTAGLTTTMYSVTWGDDAFIIDSLNGTPPVYADDAEGSSTTSGTAHELFMSGAVATSGKRYVSMLYIDPTTIRIDTGTGYINGVYEGAVTTAVGTEYVFSFDIPAGTSLVALEVFRGGAGFYLRPWSADPTAGPPVPLRVKDEGISFSHLSSALVLDEDDMVSDSDTALATQQSIKKYVDDAVAPLASPLKRLGNAALPTSATGLSTGDLWNNSGVLTIV